MKQLLLTFASCLFLSLPATFYAQEQIVPLTIGQTLTGSLGPDGENYFSIDLKKDTYVYGFAMQISVDVVVHVEDPDGEPVGQFDQPARGAENFSFVSEEKGVYKITVESFEKNEGDYSIVIKKAEPVETDPDARVDQMFSPYDNADTPGAVIGIIENGKLSFSRSYGMANLTHAIPFELNMPSNIGSVSKQFTAMAILLLEKEGKLSLEDDIRKHLPELPDFGETITIKNLLNHTNGLREVFNTLVIRGWQGHDKLTREVAIKVIQNQPALQASPGEEFNYNNTAFILCAEIIERLTEQDMDDWMRANIFLPLGMENTHLRLSNNQVIPHATQGYQQGDKGYVVTLGLDCAGGPGGVYTTVEDMAKWMQNFRNPKVGDKAIIAKMVTPDTLNNGQEMEYGLGLFIGEDQGLKMYQHGGADIAHRAMMTYYPELNAGYMIISNNAGFQMGMAMEAASLFFEEHFEKEEETASEEVAEESGEGLNVDQSILEKYVGKFVIKEANFTIEYKIEDGTFIASPQGQPDVVMVATSDSTFNYTGVDANVTFHADAEGNILLATHFQGGPITMERLTFDEASVDLSAYEGTYFSSELQTVYELMVEEDQLIARHINLEDIKLSPVNDDAFGGSVFFLPTVEFQRNDAGAVISFTVSNGRTKGILFEKQ
ncbi:MAG: beta-lactamase family protein [Bacteroidetes bacterium]|nr:beta-lactamase family protein [Bacteroidota bacterium]